MPAFKRLAMARTELEEGQGIKFGSDASYALLTPHQTKALRALLDELKAELPGALAGMTPQNFFRCLCGKS